jgi:hypothetical protein
MRHFLFAHLLRCARYEAHKNVVLAINGGFNTTLTYDCSTTTGPMTAKLLLLDHHIYHYYCVQAMFHRSCACCATMVQRLSFVDSTNDIVEKMLKNCREFVYHFDMSNREELSQWHFDTTRFRSLWPIICPLLRWLNFLLLSTSHYLYGAASSSRIVLCQSDTLSSMFFYVPGETPAWHSFM